MNNFLEELEIELEFIEDRCSLLQAIVFNSGVDSLSTIQNSLVEQQYKVMKTYIAILKIRIITLKELEFGDESTCMVGGAIKNDLVDAHSIDIERNYTNPV
ncbi:crAss001_48 related protein [Vibrio panuliri]|uniref:Uncharacterized protein n=1 Tax=Vibrio panuliri TaxID=1381081 RepID=A0ABX3F7Q3_9VIBR|nr:hypothetical protein [Vibrio panuliri]KAB1457258.1 hypothetical protein F7O85_05795 [Vibrio panuliri]OLQ84745.1 hypothetical protein BIY20_17160 [Vibrio panuliri]